MVVVVVEAAGGVIEQGVGEWGGCGVTGGLRVEGECVGGVGGVGGRG